MLTKSLILGAASIVLSLPAFGGLLGSSADVVANLGITPIVGFDACRTASVVGAPVNASVELGAGAYTGACSGLVTVDIQDGTLLITGVREFDGFDFFGDYAWLQLNFSFTGAPNIIGVILDAQSLFQDPDNWDVPMPSISFTADTITLSWDSSLSLWGAFDLAEGGTASFSVTTEDVSDVPEPGTFALLGVGLLATAKFRWRRA